MNNDSVDASAKNMCSIHQCNKVKKDEDLIKCKYDNKHARADLVFTLIARLLEAEKEGTA